MNRMKDLITVLPLLLLSVCSASGSIAQTPPAATPPPATAPAAVAPEPPTPFDLGRTDIAGWIDDVATRHSIPAKDLRDLLATGRLVDAEDAAAAQKFLGASGKHLSVSSFVFAKAGLRPDVASSSEFAATDRVMSAIGLNAVALSKNTSEDLETQFWNNLDASYNLTEAGLREELPYFITDPSNRMKVEAIMEGRQGALGAEEHQRLNA